MDLTWREIEARSRASRRPETWRPVRLAANLGLDGNDAVLIEVT
jgi:hypothetical protein